MEIITFDHEAYSELARKIDRIADYVFKKESAPAQEPEMWLTSEDVAELLHISTRTLQRMRADKTIPFSIIRNKCIYRFSDIQKCIATRMVSCNPQTLDEFRKNYWLTHKSSI